MFGGFLVVVIFLLFGLILQWTGHPIGAQSFIKYSLAWAMWPLGFILDTRPGHRWPAIFVSWFIDFMVYSFMIYLVQLLWNRKGFT